ncbi:flagellar basal body-associated FliL family protein [Gilvimarinus agarilyticus]|uniref:flagellar basal body-associated FliL family protein n=1 Tax=unclassified Gilvimarinus TaxID=2642066 RepID=UPI001C097481|nr:MULTISPECIES: flagellar basal body-associated FliL family protein [unclassified Gilvimarinus]MBU2887229.1 flagellar basal body-associated FliL family protein [Gilvimarinus agarilyticus]MDO6571888.1 flagellar basal body-associated FliL family protein [Gilvimarinus sp. 2_MG-2023]MDO6745957.1 flagellar basal body-associated FliL family protein [Gilvimarinus sp. 1_MG-2023]
MAEEDQEGGEAGAEPKTAGSKKKWIIIALILLLLIGVSVAVTLYLLNGSEDDEELLTDEVAEEIEEEAPEIQPAIYYPMKPDFTTNYEVRGRQRYMQLHVTLMLRNNDVVAALELHMPALRNAMVMLLRNQDYQELQTAEGKELLRQQALLKIQQVLEKEIGEPGIEQVLFTNMVLQ